MKTVLPIAIWLVCSSALFAQRVVEVSVVDAKTVVATSSVTETSITIDGSTSVSSVSVPGTSKEATSKVGRIRVDDTTGVLVQAFGTNFQPAEMTVLPENKGWIISKPGTYLVFVQVPNEINPVRVLVVPGSVTPPPVDPPPADDIDDLLELARENIPNDQTSVNALGSAWLSRLKALPESATLNDARAAVGKVRSDALSLIRDPGTMGWNKFLLAVDVWFSSQPAMTKVRYMAAMTALAELMVSHR